MNPRAFGAMPSDTITLREVVSWRSSAMRSLEGDIAPALRFDVNVMFTGEDGVGKKTLAHRIHRQGRWAAAPFVVVDSLDVSDSGDALNALNRALLTALPGSTILIKDAERMSPSMQFKLLEFTQPGTNGRGAGAGRQFVNGPRVRFMTATSGDLFGLVRAQEFCEPLFYCLNRIHLFIPALRDRPEDIPVLLHHFMSLDGRVPAPRLSRASLQRLVTYPWPGNVRELRAVAETLVSCGTSHLLEPDNLPPHVGR